MFPPAFSLEKSSTVWWSHGRKGQHHDIGMPNVTCVTQVRNAEYLIEQLNCPNGFDIIVIAEPAK